MVTKLDRLARSLRDARDIADELTERRVRLNVSRATVYRSIRRTPLDDASDQVTPPDAERSS